MEQKNTARFSLFPTSIGDCGIAWRGELVIATQLPEKSSAAAAARLAKRAGASKGDPPPVIQQVIDSITALLEGERTDLSDINCDFSRIETFEEKVYIATRAITTGETLTYGAIALQLGDKHFAQNVGRALGRNPFPIIVPCHRVIGANDKLVGFSAHGGVETKRRMLAIEGALKGETLGLFDDLPI